MCWQHLLSFVLACKRPSKLSICKYVLFSLFSRLWGPMPWNPMTTFWHQMLHTTAPNLPSQGQRVSHGFLFATTSSPWKVFRAIFEAVSVRGHPFNGCPCLRRSSPETSHVFVNESDLKHSLSYRNSFNIVSIEDVLEFKLNDVMLSLLKRHVVEGTEAILNVSIFKNEWPSKTTMFTRQPPNICSRESVNIYYITSAGLSPWGNGCGFLGRY